MLTDGQSAWLNRLWLAHPTPFEYEASIVVTWLAAKKRAPILYHCYATEASLPTDGGSVQLILSNHGSFDIT